MFGPPSGQVNACSVHHQYSSSVSPFHANTGVPCGDSGVPSGPTATAAAAWSWVEKMLHDAQRTSAPSATSVSISTAVWIVMWSEPVIRAPCRGCCEPYSRRRDISPGISCSASVISFRPNSASDRSATRKSFRALSATWVIWCSSFPSEWSVDGRRRKASRRSDPLRARPRSAGHSRQPRVRVSRPTGSKCVIRLNSVNRASISSIVRRCNRSLPNSSIA